MFGSARGGRGPQGGALVRGLSCCVLFGALTSWSTPRLFLGTGADGPCTPSANLNLNRQSCVGRPSADAVRFSVSNSASVGATTLQLSGPPTGLSAGDEILIIDMQGTPGDFGTVGRHETQVVASIAGSMLVLSQPLTNPYNGLTRRVMVQRIPHYTTVSIPPGVSMTADAWDGAGGGVLFLRATGAVSISGSLTMNGKGYRGSANMLATGEGTAGVSVDAGLLAQVPGEGAGRSAGNVGLNPLVNWGFDGTRGNFCASSYASVDAGRLSLGGGAGSGNQDYSTISLPGGNGGGAIAVFAKSLQITGSVETIGLNGTGINGIPPWDGSGGGGGGGVILLVGESLGLGNNLIRADGGWAGKGWEYYYYSYPQHQAGSGLIAIYYSVSVSGAAAGAFILRLPDAGTDAGTDGGADAGLDGGRDGGSDGGADAGPLDAGFFDAGSDGGRDGGLVDGGDQEGEGEEDAGLPESSRGDGGTELKRYEVGCGSHNGGGLMPLGLPAALAALAAAVRGRRRSPQVPRI